jgi:hypothetical protein
VRLFGVTCFTYIDIARNCRIGIDLATDYTASVGAWRPFSSSPSLTTFIENVEVRYVVEAYLVSRAHRTAGLIYSYNLLSDLPDFKIVLIFQYSIQQLMSFGLLSKNVMTEICRTIILPFVI